MRRTHRLSARLIRWTSLCACFALVLASLTLITPISSGSGFMPQGRNGQPNNGKAKRVTPAPPLPGAPAASLPSLEETRQRTHVEPKARQPIPSTVRSGRKPLESRQGRKVGDPLPPKKRASTDEFGDGSERVGIASADRRGSVGTARSTHARTTRSLPAGIGRRSSPASLLSLINSPRGLSNHRAFDFLRYPVLHTNKAEPASIPRVHSKIESSANSALSLADNADTARSDFFASLMPQSGSSKIVFASNRDGSMQIYAMNADGSGQTRLTYSGANDDYPRWSPNGSKIVFQSDRDNPDTGFFDIYVMNADGSGQTRLTTDPNDDSAAVWSPDGSKIAFQSARNGVNYQVYVMNADGSGQMAISENTGTDIGNGNMGSNGQPAWSPDGTKIAFTSDRDHPDTPSIYVMNVSGLNQTRLTFDYDTREEQPAWSPNGAKLAFISTRDSTVETWQETDDDGNVITKSRLRVNKEVYVMNANGGNQVRLTNTLANDDSPAWSGDGTKIVFRSDRERDCCDPNAQVWMMNPDGNGQVNLSSNGFGDYSASWISISNQSPVANAGGAYSAATAQRINFNGGGSFDLDGSIVSYSWNFGDGGTGSGAVPLHSYAATGTYTVTLTVTDNLGAQGSATTSATITTSTADAYTHNFIQVALARSPNPDEVNYWEDILRAAYAHQQGSMTIAVREMARTIFESTDYAARGRSNHEYVQDLYGTYLMRYPDAQGWAGWESECNSYGREQVRRAFDECGEFAGNVAAITPNGSASTAVSSLLSARVDPNNQTGNQLLARDAEWSLPLLSLPGRAGLDLGLGLSYSSAGVWTRSGPYSYFDEDNGPLSPGFRLGFPAVQEVFFDAQAGVNARVLIAPSGHRVELRQVGTSNVYEAADSSYLQLTDNGEQLTVSSTDGSLMSYTKLQDQWRCTEIKDRNGNYLTINNYWWGDIANITDTLGRVINFNYDGNANLVSITQSWAGQPQPHTWATFGWGNIPIQSNLPGVVGTHSGDVIPMLTQVALDDGSYYTFEYNTNGQVNLIRRYTTPDNAQRSYIGYDYAPSADGSPRLTGQRVWAENWTTGINGIPGEVVTHFSDPGDGSHVMTTPDDTIYKEFYGGGWQRGLTARSEVWSGGSQQKISTTAWMQDNQNVNYQTNPRVTEANVYDSASNRSRTTIGYYTFTLPSGVSCSLPNDSYEYQADAVNVARHTHIDYNLNTNYLNARLIGLPQAKYLYEGTSTLMAKSTYVYDWGGEYLQNQAAAPTQHNGGYSTDFVVGRGNLVDVLRWDVNDPNNASKALESRTGYDIDGSILFTRDALNHQTSISYADSFSDGNNSRHTFAYPTTATDANGYSSTLQYNFDFGAKTRVQGPPPDNQPNGIIQTFIYDSAARIQQVTTANTGAYTYYEYGPNYIQAYSTVNNVSADPHAADSYSVQVFDGAGRVFAAATNHPGSVGGYSSVYTIYDVMGRVFKQSNPTEMNGSWVASGDDAAGWIYTQQTYDWKGRPLLTSHLIDGTTKQTSYSACGCAGSEIVTFTDEVGRQQKVYSDVLGRTAKTEVLNWNSTVYATTVNTYNAADQVTVSRQFQGTDQSSVYQETTMSYDGYGRLQTKHVPEQNYGTATVYAYNADDTIYSITDARGASATYSYNNNRRLVSGINYTTPSGVTPTSSVSLGYDAVGNRTSMADGTGSVTYQYNQLSQLTSETRQFSGPGAPSGNFTLVYEHNLANQVKSVSDQRSGTSFSTVYDGTGRVNSVSAVGYGGGVTQFASQMQYRASGALKATTYGNNTNLTLGYNTRGFVSSYSSAGMSAAYQYSSDGKPKFAQDQNSELIKDRAFSYDHAGRLAEAYSGTQARDFINNTNSGIADGPFRESFNYDAWDNMLGDGWRFWSRSGATTASYNSSNRNTAWLYDADGNLLSRESDGAQYGYDAAGNNVTKTSGSTFYSAEEGGYITNIFNDSQSYDADEQLTHYVKTRSVSINGGPLGVATQEHVYNLRSTVLGGAVISEYNAQGAWNRSYVYAGGERIGEQTKAENGLAFDFWRHVDPVTGDEMKTNSSGGSMGQTILDPQGVDVGREDPFPANGSGDPDGIPNGGEPIKRGAAGMLPIEGGGTRCVLDGIEMDCSFIKGEVSVQCPNNDCTPRTIWVDVTDADGKKHSGGALTDPFSVNTDGGFGFGFAGLLLPDEFSVTVSGDDVRAAVLDFYSFNIQPKAKRGRQPKRIHRGIARSGVTIGAGIVGGVVRLPDPTSLARTESGFPDYRSVELGTKTLGPDVGIVIKVDRNIRCYVGVKGGAGVSMFPVSASYLDGMVYNDKGQRTSDPQSVRNALSGFSWSGQFTLPTTDTLGGSLNMDPILGNFPTGARTLEGGNAINIPAAASVSKEYSIKIPWLPYACRR